MMYKFGLLWGIALPRLITMIYQAPLHKDVMTPQIGSLYRNSPAMNKFLHDSPLLSILTIVG
jgi:hypothetical protein